MCPPSFPHPNYNGRLFSYAWFGYQLDYHDTKRGKKDLMCPWNSHNRNFSLCGISINCSTSIQNKKVLWCLQWILLKIGGIRFAQFIIKIVELNNIKWKCQGRRRLSKINFWDLKVNRERSDNQKVDQMVWHEYLIKIFNSKQFIKLIFFWSIWNSMKSQIG